MLVSMNRKCTICGIPNSVKKVTNKLLGTKRVMLCYSCFSMVKWTSSKSGNSLVSTVKDLAKLTDNKNNREAWKYKSIGLAKSKPATRLRKKIS